MSATLHPIFERALAPFAPPPLRCSASVAAMQQAACSLCTAST